MGIEGKLMGKKKQRIILLRQQTNKDIIKNGNYLLCIIEQYVQLVFFESNIQFGRFIRFNNTINTNDSRMTYIKRMI